MCFPEAGIETECIMQGVLGVNICGRESEEIGLGREKKLDYTASQSLSQPH